MLNKFKLVFLVLVTSGAFTCTASAQEKASFKIEHYSMIVGRDGVTRETRYSENLYRDGNQIAYVRNLPSSVKRDKPDHRDERHFDSSLSPQLITLKNNGDVGFTYLDLDNRIRIEVPKVEFNTIGFSGSWPSSYSLVDPAIFKNMAKKGAGPKVDTVIYEQISDKGLTRVLWDEKNKIALDVEVSNKDGSIKKRSKTELISQNEKNPIFTSTSGFQSKVISDYRD